MPSLHLVLQQLTTPCQSHYAQSPPGAITTDYTLSITSMPSLHLVLQQLTTPCQSPLCPVSTWCYNNWPHPVNHLYAQSPPGAITTDYTLSITSMPSLHLVLQQLTTPCQSPLCPVSTWCYNNWLHPVNHLYAQSPPGAITTDHTLSITSMPSLHLVL